MSTFNEKTDIANASVGTASGSLGAVASYSLNAAVAAAPAFVALTGTSNPFNGLAVGDRGAPSLGDIDGDGDLDLVVGEDNGLLRYYRNTGTATAPAYAEQTGTANPFNGLDGGDMSSPSTADIDGDGDLDLVVGEAFGSLLYYRNTGTATAPIYAAQTGTANPFNGFDLGVGSKPSLGDIDGDGDLDLVGGDRDSLRLQTFQNPATLTTPVYAAATGTSNPFDGFTVGAQNAPSLGDIDGDGDLDLVVGDGGGTLRYYRNTGTATAPAYAEQTETANPFNGFDVGTRSAPSFGDIDGDGDLDLVVGEGSGTLFYYRNTGTATAPIYAAQTGSANPFNGFDVGSFSTPSLGDIDGDGDLDLVVGNNGGILRYYRNTGTATTPAYAEQTGTANPFNGFIVGVLSTPSLGDIDGDGDLDLVVGESTGTLFYYRNTGSATAPAYAAQTGAANPFNGVDLGTLSRPSLGDIDGDGDLDLVGGAGGGILRLQTFINNDAPTLRQATFDLTATDANTNSTPVTLASLLASAGWADVDVGALQGLAITGSTGAGWQYSVGGTTWSPVGTASATAAVLLGAGTQLRYAPDRSNSETATLSFVAWDQTSGPASADGTARTADTTTNGGATAFSSTSSTASLVVTAVNDAPTLSQGFTLDGSTEDTSTTTTVSALLAAAGWGDVDTGALQGMAVTRATGAGPWEYSTDGAVWAAITTSPLGTVGLLLDAGTSVRYTPDAKNGETAILGFRAWDQTTGSASTNTNPVTVTITSTGGSTAFSSAVSNANLVLSSVNDAPTLSVSAFNLPDTDEDTTAVINVSDLLASGGWGDVDTSPLQGVVVTAATGSGQWQWATGGTLWVNLNTTLSIKLGVVFSPTFGLDASLRYLPNGVGGETASLSFRAWDQTVGVPSSAVSIAGTDGPPVSSIFIGSLPQDQTGGTTSQSAATSTASLMVRAVNDAPVLNAAALTLNEGQTVTLSAAHFAVVDPDNTGFSFSVSDLAGGFFQLGAAAGTAVTSFTSAELASGLVQFVDDGDEVAPAFSITANDGDLNSNTLAATIHYTPVNDAPTTRPVTLLPAMAEDSGTRTITQALLLANAADVDGPTPKAENLQISGGLGNLVNNGDGTWNYTPAPNDDTSVSFSYRISDGIDTVAGRATLDLTPANDAPVAVNDSAQTSQNTAVNIGVVANDTDVDGLVLQVAATSPGSNGTVAIRPDGVSVRYTPNTGFSGFDSFNYTVTDGAGGTATASVRVLVASLSGGAGNDVPLGTQQADFVLAQDGSDRVLTYGGDDYVDGGRGADTLTGGDGADTLLGGEGPDTFMASSSELAGDQIDGGEGTDTLVITNAPASLPANFSFTNLEQISFSGGLLVQHTALLDLSSLTLANGSSNSITGGTANSRITGTASADNIVDSAGNDDLRGAAGNDTITGGFGQDTLHGGTGNDVLYGGTATAPNDFVRDLFVFNTPLNASTNVDQIIGFQANSQDQIQLDSSIFSAITGGTTTGLDADEFRSVNGGNAVDGNDYILFDPATGNLFYDADGNGPGAKLLFATLVGLNGVLDFTDLTAGSSPG